MDLQHLYIMTAFGDYGWLQFWMLLSLAGLAGLYGCALLLEMKRERRQLDLNRAEDETWQLCLQPRHRGGFIPPGQVARVEQAVDLVRRILASRRYWPEAAATVKGVLANLEVIRRQRLLPSSRGSANRKIYADIRHLLQQYHDWQRTN